jgi:hypothetical protein
MVKDVVRVVLSVPMVLLVLGTMMAAHKADGQTTPTASRVVGLSVFGAGSRDWTDYGSAGSGYIVGADVTRPFHHLEPSIEARYGWGSGNAVTEKTFEGGLKLAKALGPGGRFHPYGEVQVGYGAIDFKFLKGSYTHDNSIIYGVGGGADFDLPAHFALKGDWQYEFWNLGSGSSALTPSAVSGGVVYHIPFRAYGRRQ